MTNRLARQATVRVTETYLRYAAGDMTLSESVGVMAALIATAQRRAVSANDLIMAAEMSQRLERSFDSLGISWGETPEDQLARLSKSLSEVIHADPDYVQKGKTREQRKQREAHSTRARLERLTDGEVSSASQWARQAAAESYEEQGYIRGWYRSVNPGACKFCRTMAGSPPDKYVHPVQHRLGGHPGCKCSQSYVDEVEPWQRFVGPREQMSTLSDPATTDDVPASSDQSGQ